MDIINEIKNLKTLLDQGAINQEEFNSLKKNLLNEEFAEKNSEENILNSLTNEPVTVQHISHQSISDVKKPPIKDDKSGEYQAGTEFTGILAYLVLGVAIILSIVLWVRYNNFWIFLISLGVSILTPLGISKLTPKASLRNLYLSLLIVLYGILVFVPIGNISGTSSSSSIESSTDDIPVLHCVWCKKVVYGKAHEDLMCYTNEPDGCGIVFFNSGTKYAFCSEQCCQLYRSVK